MHVRPTHFALLPTTSIGMVLLFALATLADEPQSVLVELAAGDHDRQQTPVLLELPQALRAAEVLSLVRVDTGKAIDVQVLAGDPPRAAWILAEPLSAGQTRQYRLTAADAAAKAKSAVTCRDDGKRLAVSVGDRPVLCYQHAVAEPPDGVEAHYRRSGFIHPLRSPAGRVLTDDFPVDHLHQHAVFFSWVNTTFENRKVDFWNQASGLGTVEHVKLGETVSGPVFAQFTATLHYIDLKAPGGRKPALAETWTVRIYNIGDPFVIDLESRQLQGAGGNTRGNIQAQGAAADQHRRQGFVALGHAQLAEVQFGTEGAPAAGNLRGADGEGQPLIQRGEERLAQRRDLAHEIAAGGDVDRQQHDHRHQQSPGPGRQRVQAAQRQAFFAVCALHR